MTKAFGNRLTGVFLEVVHPELWPSNNRTNDRFVYQFLRTLQQNIPNSSFTGVYTNKSSFAAIVGP